MEKKVYRYVVAASLGRCYSSHPHPSCVYADYATKTSAVNRCKRLRSMLPDFEERFYVIRVDVRTGFRTGFLPGF